MTADPLISRINKKLGDGTLVPGSLLRDQHIARVTTGSIALDLALGGGWPLNCWSEIQGEPSNGKTALAMKTIAANQAIHKDFHCLWIAAEAFVPVWAQTCGMDLNRVTVCSTQVMEEAYQVAIEYLNERAVDAVVIDSLSALVPTEEDEKAVDQMQVALGARVTGKFMKKSSVAQRRSLTEPDRPCLGLITSQWREKVGVLWGDTRVTPYGRAKEFFYMVRLEVKRDEWLGTDKRRVGLTLKGHCTKNKTAPPQRMAVWDFYWEDFEEHEAGSYDVPKQLALIAMDVGIIELHGNTYRYHNDKFVGKAALFEAIRTDAALVRSLDRDIRIQVLHEAPPKRRLKAMA